MSSCSTIIFLSAHNSNCFSHPMERFFTRRAGPPTSAWPQRHAKMTSWTTRQPNWRWRPTGKGQAGGASATRVSVLDKRRKRIVPNKPGLLRWGHAEMFIATQTMQKQLLQRCSVYVTLIWEPEWIEDLQKKAQKRQQENQILKTEI